MSHGFDLQASMHIYYKLGGRIGHTDPRGVTLKAYITEVCLIMLYTLKDADISDCIRYRGNQDFVTTALKIPSKVSRNSIGQLAPYNAPFGHILLNSSKGNITAFRAGLTK